MLEVESIIMRNTSTANEFEAVLDSQFIPLTISS